MPVRAICPECGATAILHDETPNLTIECRQCGKEVPVPDLPDLPISGPPPLPGTGGPPPLPKADAGFEVLDDEDEGEGEAPRRPPAAAHEAHDDEDRDDD